MKKIIFSYVFTSHCVFAWSQNVGINTTTLRFPLSFGTVNDAKISLLDDGNPAGLNFGFGVRDEAYIFLLINAVKEQQKQIDQLKAMVDSMQKK